MKRLILIVVAIICGATAIEEVKNVAEVTVKVVDNIEKFKKDNPTVQLLPMSIARNPRSAQNIYTLGARQPGDFLSAAGGDWVQYGVPQNLELKLSYPGSGAGAILTYVQVTINQDNYTSGRGYVVAGGIGQRYAEVIIEAWNTAYLRWDYLFYGY
jgi:hypothetical protein